jgi:uncharacterized protein
MAVYLTPGVYRRPRRIDQRDIRLVRTDVAGFVGFAERGPLPQPNAALADAISAAIRLTSWNEFLAIFGGFMLYGYLAYAVRAFFDNGGTTCYVVRVAALKPGKSSQGLQKASYDLPSTPYGPGLVATAISEGNWANRIHLTITSLTSGDTAQEFALRVTLTSGRDPSRPAEEEFYNHLSVLKGPFYAPDRVNNFSNLITLNAAASFPGTAPALLVGRGPLASGPVQLEGGQDGLSEVSIQDFTGGPDDFRGLRILEEIDEVAILCVPDAVFEPPIALSVPNPPPADPCAKPPPAQERQPSADDETAIPPLIDTVSIYRTMIDQCERLRDRFAILDYPENEKRGGDLRKWKDQFITRFAAIYYPWLKVPDPLGIEGPSRRLPAAGHVAGVYARIDNQFGVARPPANAALEFVTDVMEDLTDLDQQNLNPYGINAIRSFPGRGIRVWGARSLAGPDDTEWEFIHVRRLMSMIEESVEVSMQWAVFEPNDFALRQTLVHSLSVFLEAIWRKGGLKGARPSEGFYVKCDETNNPPTVVDVGQIVCEVGIAVAAPMEFLVFEIRQDPGGSAVTEP